MAFRPLFQPAFRIVKPMSSSPRLSHNPRRFRLFLSVATLRAPSLAAVECRVSQPAVTQALNKLDLEAGGPVFDRTRQGFFLTARGHLIEPRIRRAMARLDRALAETAPRLVLTTTASQLRALIAMTEVQNFTLAARRLGLAQPTVHKAITQVEKAAARVLFERTSFGMVPTRTCRDLAQAARLAYAEIQQANADLADFDGRDVGQITIGSLPLSRSVLLPEALTRFRIARPTQGVCVVDGPYAEMLTALRRGDIDFVVGALRDPSPIEDVIQDPLFDDGMCLVVRNGHPLAGRATAVPLGVLATASWVVPRSGTPSRAQFDAAFRDAALPPPESVLECGSILLMRELLTRSDMIGCISAHQAAAEIENGLLVAVRDDIRWTGRAIGLTYRKDWVPTRAQALLLDMVRSAATSLAGRSQAPRLNAF